MVLLKNVSIKKKLTVILVAISLISVLVTTLALTLIGIFNLRQSIIHELEVSARIVGERNLVALLFEDVEFATKNLEIFELQPAIRRVCLYTKEGILFAGYSRGGETTAIHCNKTIQKIRYRDNYFYALQPLFDEKQGKAQEKIGSILIESDQRKIKNYIDKQLVITFTVVLAALLFSYLLALALQRTISQPILKLAHIARQISSEQDFSLRAIEEDGGGGDASHNEISSLYRAFNTMLIEIDAREQQLLQINEKLYNAKVTAERASRAKSDFLANISHELRTPLNAIIGFSSIILNQLFGALGNDKYMEYAKDINESGVHLLDIINDILDLSKAEAGKLSLSFEEVNITKIIRKCITLLAERAHEQQVSILTQIPDNLPILIADNLRFTQIILNILSNAVKFTNHGGKVTISVATLTAGGAVSDFIVTIEDTGIGMSPDEVEKAFQSFGQIDSGLNRKYEGTGLGLPLTQKLVELHHGKIFMESTKGKGTTVKLHFLANPIYVNEMAQMQNIKRVSSPITASPQV
jgi:signal transduction histidine kinase